MKNKVVFNNGYGGFAIPKHLLNELGAKFEEDVARHDPRLVAWVEAGGAEFSSLEVAEISEDRYFIQAYDGLENVVTPSAIRWTVIK